MAENIYMIVFFSTILSYIFYQEFFKFIRRVRIDYVLKNKNILFILSPEFIKHKHSQIIDIDDDNQFINWYSTINVDEKLEIIINARGGSIFSSDVILNILLLHDGEINIYIPYFSYSAGSMLALCANNLYLNNYSLMSPVDPQIDYDKNQQPVKSYLKYARVKGLSRMSFSDVMKYYECKSLYDDNIRNMKRMLRDKYSKNKMENIIKHFGRGIYPHDKQFNIDELENMGLIINSPVPKKYQETFKRIIKID
tara:strand:+ start:1007 stop:1765 length:759 start_codon:yes stop_codon:yes gene_type:complete